MAVITVLNKKNSPSVDGHYCWIMYWIYCSSKMFLLDNGIRRHCLTIVWHRLQFCRVMN